MPRRAPRSSEQVHRYVFPRTDFAQPVYTETLPAPFDETVTVAPIVQSRQEPPDARAKLRVTDFAWVQQVEWAEPSVLVPERSPVPHCQGQQFRMPRGQSLRLSYYRWEAQEGWIFVNLPLGVPEGISAILAQVGLDARFERRQGISLYVDFPDAAWIFVSLPAAPGEEAPPHYNIFVSRVRRRGR